ncbi:hypothetical protein [Streptomyces sp. NPDC002564]
MVIPFVVGVSVLVAVASAGLWVGLEFRKECRARARGRLRTPAHD